MERISVVGTSGSGKTTVGRAISTAMGLPFTELDSLWHGPNWTNPPPETFRASVESVAAQPTWVIDGKYRGVRELIWSRATTVVWLDYSRPRVMRQVTTRTIGRILTRERLWEGNRERWWLLFSRETPIRWAWSTHASSRAGIANMLTEPRFDHIQVVRLADRAATKRWLEALDPGA